MTTENIFNHPYYRLNKIFLSRLGTWPEQSLFMRCLMPFLFWAVLMSVMIPELIRLPSVYRARDIDTLLECIPPILVMILSFTQLFNGSFNREMIQAMLDRISSDWQRLGQSPNIEIIHKYAARGRFITRTYTTAMYAECVIYLMTPLLSVILDFVIPLNESRQKIFLFEAEYGVDSADYYWPILGHSYITTFTAIIVLIYSDAMLFTMVEHACALFEIVGLNLKMVRTTAAADSAKDDYRMICHCIDLHREAITFADLIEGSYSASFVGVIGLCLIILSITGVQTIMHLDEPQQAVRYGSFTIAQIIHLYLNSVPGQKLMDYSLSVFDHAYADNWDGLSSKAKKLLVMIMIRSSRPCQLTAGKIYVVSMENYSAVMQTSMSYFTVLSSMR